MPKNYFALLRHAIIQLLNLFEIQMHYFMHNHGSHGTDVLYCIDTAAVYT